MHTVSAADKCGSTAEEFYVRQVSSGFFSQEKELQN